MTMEECPVGEVMSTELLAVTDTESVLMAWELMRQGGYHHVPVIDAGGRIVDVLDAETLAVAWDSGGPDRMRKPVSTLTGRRGLPRVSLRDSVAAAARAMLTAGTDFVSVLDEEERLVGLFTAHDLIALAAGERRRVPAAHVTVPALYRIEPVLPRPRVSARPPA